VAPSTTTIATPTSSPSVPGGPTPRRRRGSGSVGEASYGPDGELVRLDDPVTQARFARHRAAVDRGERRLVEICEEEGLRLAVDRMWYFSHWITPEGAPRRYDTRFFVARAPDAQEPLHDDREVIATLWIRPAEALERHRAGEYDLILPTMRSLRTLEGFRTADELLAAVAATDHVPAILPRIVDDAGGFRILLPGDEGYDDVALPPVRLPAGVPVHRLVPTPSPADVDAR
jgi:hypothetical protein